MRRLCLVRVTGRIRRGRRFRVKGNVRGRVMIMGQDKVGGFIGLTMVGRVLFMCASRLPEQDHSRRQGDDPGLARKRDDPDPHHELCPISTV